MRGGTEVAIFVARHVRTDVLVVHRSPDGGAYWHTIAGAIEPGESAAAAAARELLEETGLDVAPSATGISFAYQLRDEAPERRAEYEPGLTEVHVECFIVDAPDEWEPRLDAEHDAYRWLPAAEAPRMLYWPDVAEAMRQALDAP